MLSSKSFTTCDTVTHTGNTDTWFTPHCVVSPLGKFDLDPCTESFRPFDTAKHHICRDVGGDGLIVCWKGRVWLNPPYGKQTPHWLDKLYRHGNGIALVFARTETKWAQEYIKKADAVNFLAGRIAFLKSDDKPSTNAGTGSMLLAFGRNNVESIRNLNGIIFNN